MNQDVIFGINGPVVTVQNSRSFSMMEQVYVGNSRLVGEVIKISDQITTIPVLALLIGEGGSGGALALAVADQVWMMENAVYSVISPEGLSLIHI